MSAPRIVVFPVFVCCLSFLKYSISEKPEDCKKGKQYWSVSDILSTAGTCVRCPRKWKSCKEQPIADRSSCELSCRVLDSATPKPTLNPTVHTSRIASSPSQPTPSKETKIPIKSNGSLAVVYPTAKHPPEINKVQKSHVVKEGLSKETLIVVGCLCGLVLIIIAAVVLYVKMRKESVGHRDEAEGGGIDVREVILPLEPLQDGGNDHELEETPQHPLEVHAGAVPGRNDEDVLIAIQEEQLSTTSTGRIQDEHNFSSAIKLDEKYN